MWTPPGGKGEDEAAATAAAALLAGCSAPTDDGIVDAKDEEGADDATGTPLLPPKPAGTPWSTTPPPAGIPAGIPAGKPKELWALTNTCGAWGC